MDIDAVGNIPIIVMVVFAKQKRPQLGGRLYFGKEIIRVREA